MLGRGVFWAQSKGTMTLAAVGSCAVNNVGSFVGRFLLYIHMYNMQCIYISSDDPCSVCVKRGWTCGVKVWGPKRIEREKELVLHSNEEIPTLRSPLSIINDVNITDQELFYLRGLHRLDYDSSHSATITVILQHLWYSYGLVFTDNALLNATLAYATRRLKGSPEHKSDDVFNFRSRLHKSLMAAIHRDEITECHLFANCLAMASCPMDDIESISIYTRGFFDTLKHMERKSINEGAQVHNNDYTTSISLLRDS